MEVTSDMTPTYERREDGTIVKYEVVGTKTFKASDLREEKKQLKARILEINQILGEI